MTWMQTPFKFVLTMMLKMILQHLIQIRFQLGVALKIISSRIKIIPSSKILKSLRLLMMNLMIMMTSRMLLQKVGQLAAVLLPVTAVEGQGEFDVP